MYKAERLVPNTIRLTPRRGLAAQMLAIWSTGYDYPLATFIWNTVASRALSNKTEVDMIVNARMSDTGETYEEAFKAIVLESGMFKIEGEQSEISITLKPSTYERLQAIAQEQGKTLEQYLDEVAS